MRLYIVTEVENERVFKVNAFDSKDKALKFAHCILEGMHSYTEDIDHNDMWHCLWETGTSTIEIHSVELNNEDII